MEAQWFVESVCRDFPRLHRMSQLHEGRLFTNQLKSLTMRSEPLRIIDAFPFFNEIEMLRVRFEELSPVVDKFILVESEMTHSGKPKELLFEQNRELFEPWLDKIIHVGECSVIRRGRRGSAHVKSHLHLSVFCCAWRRG